MALRTPRRLTRPRAARAPWALVLAAAVLVACGREAPRAVPVAFAPASLDLSVEAPSARVTVLAAEPLDLDASTTAPWLAVAPARLRAPGAFEVRADPSGLADGSHSAQVLVRPAGSAAVFPLAVVLRVGTAAARAPGPPAAPGATPDASPAPPEAPKAPAAPEVPYGQRAIEAGALDRVKAATVLIESRYRPLGSDPATLAADARSTAQGSGFVVHEGGLIVTNAHVVEASQQTEGRGPTPVRRAASSATAVLESVTVRVRSGTEATRVYPAQVLVTHPYPVDLALLRIVPEEPLVAVEGLEPAFRGSLNYMAQVTHRVWAVGFPLGEQMESELERFRMTRNPDGPDVSVREGTITAFRKDADGAVKAVEHSCAIEPGNSGGPLVDSNGMLVGVNTLGGGRSAFAIPVHLMLDMFFDTMACHGYGNLFEQASRRVLTVDPAAEGEDPPDDAPGTALVFRSIPAALKAARNGDLVRVVEGEFVLAEVLAVRTGVRLRGAGAGRTVLRAKGTEEKPFSGYCVYMGGKRFVEVSDLTVVNEEGNGVWFVADSGDEQYLHDVEIRAQSWALGFGKGCKAKVTRCEVHGGVVAMEEGCAPRLERVTLRPGTVSLFTRTAFLARDGARPALVGCRIAAEFVGVDALSGSRVAMEACEAMAGEGPIARVHGAEFEADRCWFLSRGEGLLATGEAKVRATGTVFVSEPGPALRVRGGDARATLERCRFEPTTAGLLVEEGAKAELRACAFDGRAERPPDAYPWTDGPKFWVRAAVALPAFPTLEARLRWEAEMREAGRRTARGVVVAGAGSRVDLEGCLFQAKGGAAVRVEAGADAVDRGGNEFEGLDFPVWTTDERTYLVR